MRNAEMEVAECLFVIISTFRIPTSEFQKPAPRTYLALHPWVLRLKRRLTSSARLRTITLANTISIHMAAAGAVSPASSILMTATEAWGRIERK